MPRYLIALLSVALIVQTPVARAADDPLVAAAVAAAVDGSLRQITTRTEAEIRSLLIAGNNPDMDRLSRLSALREFGRYFSRIDRKKLTQSQIDTLKWLAEKPKLLTTLMLAVGTTDSPEDVIQVLDALRVDMGDRLEQYPDLTTAICVVWDSSAPRAGGRRPAQPAPDKVDIERPKLLMRYYTNARDRLRYDLRTMPFQLSAYVVDNLVSEEEIVWALDRYAGRSAIGSTYFDVPYDFGAYYGFAGSQAEARGQAYTLPNLVTLGGICADQAYFASQVARTMGVPAIIAAGRSGTGETSHAWVGYLNQRGNNTMWDFDEGRYVEYRFFKGRCIDPQTREGLTESDISLLAELWDRTPNQRLASIALVRSADLVEESRRASLYMQAINLSPGNRAAWFALADMGSKSKLTEAQTREFYAVVEKFAVRDYPDFALAVLLRSIGGRGTQQQLQMINNFKGLFDPNRPDIQADLDLARGDLMRREKRAADALVAYGDAIDRYGTYGPIAMDVMEKIDELLREARELNRLADIYQHVWRKLAVPDISAYVQTTPFYILGERYEVVLREIGDRDEAAMVRMRLDSVNTSSQSQNGTRSRARPR